MGVLTNNHHWMETYDFKYKKGPLGPEKGYVRTFPHSENSERLWVTVDFNRLKVYLYNELDCGGELYSRIVDIPSRPDLLLNNVEFINWLDSLITPLVED